MLKRKMKKKIGVWCAFFVGNVGWGWHLILSAVCFLFISAKHICALLDGCGVFGKG